MAQKPQSCSQYSILFSHGNCESSEQTSYNQSIGIQVAMVLFFDANYGFRFVLFFCALIIATTCTLHSSHVNAKIERVEKQWHNTLGCMNNNMHVNDERRVIQKCTRWSWNLFHFLRRCCCFHCHRCLSAVPIEIVCCAMNMHWRDVKSYKIGDNVYRRRDG